MQHLEPLLSAQDLARYHDVPVATVYAWRYRGVGPPGLRVGKHLRYRRIDVNEWIGGQLEDPGRDRYPASAPSAAFNTRRASRRGRVG